MTLPRKELFDLPEGVLYLDGNSLGPLPKGAAERVAHVMRDEWGADLIKAWNTAGWMDLPRVVGDRIGQLIGAPEGSVATGDTLSIKVYQALAAALQMRPERKVVLSDTGNFPSDLYMAQGLIDTIGKDHELRLVAPEDVAGAIGEDLAAVLLTEVDFRSGRRHDMGAITRLTLNAPGSLNALSDAMLARLSEEFSALMLDAGQRVVILRGSGKAFCAGHDLKEMMQKRQAEDGGAASLANLFTRCSEVMQTIRRLPQPVIAQVHGIATAAGCQLVASCDLAVAADDTRFGVNGVNIGLFCSTPMVALSRNIPRKQAFEMLTTGRFFYATRAVELGLINKAVAAEALEAETLDLAETIAGKLGSAVRIGKRAFYDQMQMTQDQAYQIGRAHV